MTDTFVFDGERGTVLVMLTTTWSTTWRRRGTECGSWAYPSQDKARQDASARPRRVGTLQVHRPLASAPRDPGPVRTDREVVIDELRSAHTADLTPPDLLAIRRLLDGAFPPDEAYTEQDHEHALGGVHAMVWEGEDLVAHGAVVMRRLLHDGRALRTGYVEAVAVRADRRRCGLGGAVMAELERVVRGAYELGALSASGTAGTFYASRGWQVWRGTVSIVTPRGIERAQEEEGGIYVLRAGAELSHGGDLACDWRDGDAW